MSTANLDLSKTITSDDILGKDVIDPQGEFLGVVEIVHIDPVSIDIIGISVDKGFLKKGLAIGKNYIERITPHAIFLKVRPMLNMRGMKVFDNFGKFVGLVSHVEQRGGKNHLKYLEVRHGMMRKKITIHPQHIKSVGENIFLKGKKEDFLGP